MTNLLDRGTLIGVVCGVIGSVLLAVVILLIICVCKKRKQSKRTRSHRKLRVSGSSSPEALRETILSNFPPVAPNTTDNLRGAGDGDEAVPDVECVSYLRQYSHSSAASQITTTTPLAPATPIMGASHQNHSHEIISPLPINAVNVTNSREEIGGILSQESSYAPTRSSQNNLYTAVGHAPAYSLNRDGSYATSSTAQPDWRTNSQFQYIPPITGYDYASMMYRQSNPPMDRNRSNSSATSNAGGRSWGIVPLMSTDLFLTRDTRSGEMYVAGLNEATAAHLDATDAERASIADYQHDLDAAGSFSSLSRRSGNQRNPSPMQRGFVRSTSHSLHSINRSHTPSILEEPEPNDADADGDFNATPQIIDECIYVNIHADSSSANGVGALSQSRNAADIRSSNSVEQIDKTPQSRDDTLKSNGFASSSKPYYQKSDEAADDFSESDKMLPNGSKSLAVGNFTMRS